ncbi:hypothetical protein [Kitasatospora kifunensis]|uniref:Uncharacterized protein n=1 Tax=Kitasatospora kifunensis TaxID=58351 RepID=A0A7W7R564_KITKI|nr:hypothetical protein [Kitasatospora kifunensis]MBB4925607.1 hypothetical protein [Kitasatospora kifunensis]
MDTPNQPSAGEAATEPSQVCPPPAPSQAPSRAEPGRRDPGAATTANLRAGLASRLRSAYEQGADLDELATASHQSTAEVEQLLTLAGIDLAADRPRPPAALGRTRPDGTALDRTEAVPVQPDGLPGELPADLDEAPGSAAGADDGWRPSSARPRPRIRRPAPPRRLVLRPGSAERREPVNSANDAAAAAAPGTPVAPDSAAGTATDDGTTLADALTLEAQRAAEAAEAAETSGSGTEAPLGILIGGPRPMPTSAGRLEAQRSRRVTAQLIRVGRGTTLAVLPSWRPSIAISIPTESLLNATGLSYEELGRAELTVLINADALHDRELRPRDWQVTPDHGSGRRRRG